MTPGGHGTIPHKTENTDNFLLFKIGSETLFSISKVQNKSIFSKNQQIKYAAHIIRASNCTKNKMRLFNSNKNTKKLAKIHNLIECIIKKLVVSDQNHFYRITKERKEEQFYKPQSQKSQSCWKI